MTQMKVWRLSPEQMNAYESGEDLGEPDVVVQPASLAGMNECTIVRPSLKQRIGQGRIPMRQPRDSFGELVNKPIALPVRKVSGKP
ncbi:hypothetical protein COLU111180_04255 [Cohnella lubricantis]|nr:hypothetical protein [Cohnella lubricantis]